VGERKSPLHAGNLAKSWESIPEKFNYCQVIVR
jgi:hypothetical protein